MNNTLIRQLAIEADEWAYDKKVSNTGEERDAHFAFLVVSQCVDMVRGDGNVSSREEEKWRNGLADLLEAGFFLD